MRTRGWTWVVIALAGCGGQVGAASDAGDATATDTQPADTAESGPAEAGTITPQTACAHSTTCGAPGESCCIGGGPTCDCQSRGQPRCLDQPFAQTGAAGDGCRPDDTCDPGLTCVQFGIAPICLVCP